jgi:hypothetical protein
MLDKKPDGLPQAADDEKIIVVRHRDKWRADA